MNGVHDMGGLQGFGPVRPEADEPVFHADWERRILGVTLAMGASGQWNLDMSRSARETLPPATYLSASYYEIWVRALEALMLERGLVTPEELATGTPLSPPAALPVLRREAVDTALARGSPTLRPSVAVPRFAVGQRVRALNMHPHGHTRLPRYVRGHVGTVRLLHGPHVFPDRHAVAPAAGVFDDRSEQLYTVAFDGRELWGSAAEAGLQVCVDAWEPYLEATT